ncbi:cyclin-T2-like [Hypomesus transpacificus]|uniref:cyclin-T2-like n=1 Tax=Hypomesus transpacificus TaxID=137520 RepID=UPI001F0829B7|nr:cyclin-T2-like [Hypomesus transpacificus]
MCMHDVYNNHVICPSVSSLWLMTVCLLCVLVSSLSLHLTTFCLQHKPTVIACVCIHLACKWSNWEIPVSTDGKHWWEYLDRSVTLQLLDELTHEFLQILEKTPSRLKRIRNWRATQAAKKPKTDFQSGDNAFQGTSSMDSIPGVTSNSFFPSTSMLDSGDMLSLDGAGASYGSYPALGDPSDACGFDQGPFFPSLVTHSKYTPSKHEHKAGSGGEKHPQPSNPPTFNRPLKMTLDRYREKHAADLALHNGREEQPGEVYLSPTPSGHHHHHHHHHKKRSQPQQAPPAGERRDKTSSKKPRPPPSFAENGSASSEELKMRIKVSSERSHTASEQGGATHGRDKHKDHSSHRHPKHGHSHPYPMSGNGRGGADGATLAFRGPTGHSSDSGSSSSRKRGHPDSSHNHHHHSAKSSRSSKNAGGSAHYSSEGNQRTVERHGHDGTNGTLGSNGQHTDYKDTFDMLDSLLSAQGMNL